MQLLCLLLASGLLPFAVVGGSAEQAKGGAACSAKGQSMLQTESAVDKTSSRRQPPAAAVGGAAGSALDVKEARRCVADTFQELRPQATYGDAKDLLIKLCASGQGAHPHDLCRLGANELFKSQSLEQSFDAVEGDDFCTMVKDQVNVHREWRKVEEKLGSAALIARQSLSSRQASLDSLDNSATNKGCV